jgi:hypothetical protein
VALKLREQYYCHDPGRMTAVAVSGQDMGAPELLRGFDILITGLSAYAPLRVLLLALR